MKHGTINKKQLTSDETQVSPVTGRLSPVTCSSLSPVTSQLSQVNCLRTRGFTPLEGTRAITQWFKKYSARRTKHPLTGFTLLELVIVFAILALLAGIVLSSFSSFRNSKVLDTASEESLALLSEARGNTLSGKDGYQYGIHLDAGQMVLYRGAVYVSGDSNNKIVVLDGALEIDNMGGGSDILFDRLTGKTAQPGSFVIRVKSDTTKARTITVVGTGIASGS